MMKGAGAPDTAWNFLMMIPEMMTRMIPITYAKTATQTLPARAPAIAEMTGSFAPQGMNVHVMAVIRRSDSLSMVLVDMTPGTPHPVLTIRGMNDFPERLKYLKIRSMTNATRAMYPTSSRMTRQMNRTII